jgi:hypothetical protein
MTWKQAQLALQLLGEERVGFVRRARAEMVKAQEDAAFADLASQIGGQP